MNPEGRIKYLVATLLVQPEEDGPRFLLGNAFNDPTQRKPVIISVGVMSNVICIVRESDSCLGGYYKLGTAFTKTSCTSITVKRFLTKDNVSYILAVV